MRFIFIFAAAINILCPSSSEAIVFFECIDNEVNSPTRTIRVDLKNISSPPWVDQESITDSAYEAEVLRRSEVMAQGSGVLIDDKASFREEVEQIAPILHSWTDASKEGIILEICFLEPSRALGQAGVVISHFMGTYIFKCMVTPYQLEPLEVHSNAIHPDHKREDSKRKIYTLRYRISHRNQTS